MSEAAQTVRFTTNRFERDILDMVNHGDSLDHLSHILPTKTHVTLAIAIRNGEVVVVED